MKKSNSFLFFAFLLTVLVSNKLEGQNIQIRSDKAMKSDTIAKKILDRTTYRIFYSYDHQKDPQDAKSRVRSLTLLQIGNKYNRFMDYFKYRMDSVNDVSVKKKLPVVQLMPMLTNIGRQIKFRPSVIQNRVERKCITQQNIVLSEIYQYEEATPKIQWEMLKGDTIISGYKCKKAKATFRGRKYIAWYSQDVEMPFGPYKFGGLPGLIFCLYDVEKHYIFTLNGLEKIKYYDPIYLWTRKVIKTTREDAQKIHKNFCADPVKALFNSGKDINIPKETQATVQPLPYNPIERE